MFRAMVAATVILVDCGAMPVATLATSPPTPNSHGLTLVGMTEVNERLLDVVVSTEEIFQPMHLKIYLSAGYRNSTRRYPTLYLMHGGGSVVDNAGSWLEEGDVADIVDQSGYSGIVVMPEAEGRLFSPAGPCRTTAGAARVGRRSTSDSCCRGSTRTSASWLIGTTGRSPGF